MPEFTLYYDAVFHFSGSQVINAATEDEARQLMKDPHRALDDCFMALTPDHVVSIDITDVETTTAHAGDPSCCL